jgi:hypothetical protein
VGGRQRAVETGACHIDAAVDFSAVEIHIILEHCAVAQEQTAFGVQTFAVEDIGHQRAVERYQTVCSCIAQVDRAFDPAAIDFDRPNELRVSEIDIPHDPGALDPDSPERHRIPPRARVNKSSTKREESLRHLSCQCASASFLGSSGGFVAQRSLKSASLPTLI